MKPLRHSARPVEPANHVKNRAPLAHLEAGQYKNSLVSHGLIKRHFAHLFVILLFLIITQKKREKQKEATKQKGLCDPTSAMKVTLILRKMKAASYNVGYVFPDMFLSAHANHCKDQCA